jgi:hypothetical protein
MSQATTRGQDEGPLGVEDKKDPREDIDKNGPSDSGDVPILTQKQTRKDVVEQIPWRYKLAAGSMIILFAFGSSLSESTFGPLKSTLIEELGITSRSTSPTSRLTGVDAQYGAIASASSLVNTILPIVGGIYMDHVGDITPGLVEGWADHRKSGELHTPPSSPARSF